MRKEVLLILIDHRKDSAPKVQKILTAYGCIIKTRLGVHDGVMENCSPLGLLMCELVGDWDKQDELAEKLTHIKGVHTKLVRLSVEDK